MKAVLMSTRPEWCKKIASGEKTVEVRRNRPKLGTPFKVYVYCTRNGVWLMKTQKGLQKMQGKIIGEFICDKVVRIGIPYPAYKGELDERFTKDSCVSYDELHRYASTNALRDDLFFWHISNFKLYDEPVKLEEFWGIKPCSGKCHTCRRLDAEAMECKGEHIGIDLTPRSWCYVEVSG